jgi:hypothetical protein
MPAVISQLLVHDDNWPAFKLSLQTSKLLLFTQFWKVASHCGEQIKPVSPQQLTAQSVQAGICECPPLGLMINAALLPSAFVLSNILCEEMPERVSS